ncbi:hypothetical protein [Nitrosomonas oligotropha]|uniref:hypothetical protein n=1 Tax=Nitrosomonas oligotropha TaxID=42354 RepID=UPI00136B4B2E|nr:hypothetical protein [Nitrosomonas oligotropha]MXS81571.1 hypothetical protein [Nitrosomonas oligotropha]
MKIKMITTMAGPARSVQSGQVIDLPGSEAVDLISGGYAVPFKSETIETATVQPPETSAVITPQPEKKSAKPKKP